MSNEMTGSQKIFYDHAKKKIEGMIPEYWIGRYRVDFCLQNQKIVIEIDGYDYHSTKVQRTNDAKRDRYLQRLGFIVIRFTGSEINKSVETCIEEVIQYIKSTEIKTVNNKSIFIDLLFLAKTTVKTTMYYREEYPAKGLQIPSLSALLREISCYLSLSGDYNVFIFGLSDFFSNSLIDLDVIKYLEYSEGLLTVYEEHVGTDLLVNSICDLMQVCRDKGDEIILVGDDLGYVPILQDKNWLTKLMRLNKDETSMIGLDVKWQDIDYAVAAALGLDKHEW